MRVTVGSRCRVAQMWRTSGRLVLAVLRRGRLWRGPGAGVHFKAPVAEFLFVAFVNAQQDVAGGPHVGIHRARRAGPDAERQVAVLRGFLGVATGFGRLLVFGIGRGRFGAHIGHVQAGERTGRAVGSVLVLDLLSQFDQLLGVGGNIDSHVLVRLVNG